jgi:hypothetical protein
MVHKLQVRNKISKANGAFNQLQKVRKSSDVSLRTKLRIFNSNVKSILLCGLRHGESPRKYVENYEVL